MFQSHHKRCSFCGSKNHNIRNCHSSEAHKIHTFINLVLFQMSNEEQKNCLQNYSIRKIKIISVILDLKIMNTKLENIENITNSLLLRRLQLNEVVMFMQNLENIHIQEEEISQILITKNSNAINEESNDCPICFNTYSKEEIYKTNCNHVFCKECMTNHLEISKSCNCPICRIKITILNEIL